MTRLTDRHIVLFCGHRSSLGLFFLEALSKSKFQLDTIVLASEKRWRIFDEQLNEKRSASLRSKLHRFRAQLALQKRLRAFKERKDPLYG